MAKNLLIVESPAKAKTIEKFLGKDFQVKSCFGHIRDLEKAGMGIDIEKKYEPRYIISDGKEKVVRELKTLAGKSEEVNEYLVVGIDPLLVFRDSDYKRASGM